MAPASRIWHGEPELYTATAYLACDQTTMLALCRETRELHHDIRLALAAAEGSI